MKYPPPKIGSGIYITEVDRLPPNSRVRPGLRLYSGFVLKLAHELQPAMRIHFERTSAAKVADLAKLLGCTPMVENLTLEAIDRMALTGLCAVDR